MHEVYRHLMVELHNHGVVETNARTNTRIKLIRGAWAFKLDMLPGKLPVPGNRKYFPHVAAAEVAWQLLGTKDPTFIMRHAPKVWGKFLEYKDNDDEPRYEDADGAFVELKTAYGYRGKKHLGRDQLQLAIDELRSNPTNRQLYVSAWDPSSDGLGGPQPKNIPCPVGFAVSRFNDALHMSVHVRSSDTFVGLPYDVMGYALMLDAIAAEVDCRPATLAFTLAHAHLYEPHWLMNQASTVGGTDVKGASTNWVTGCEPNLPGWSIKRIVEDPDGYVEVVKGLAKRVGSNSWNPMPEVIA